MTFSKGAPRSVLLAGAALCALPAFAHAEDIDPYAIAGVVVTAAMEPLGDQPLSVQTLDAATIAATVNANTAEDALKYLPNLFVRRRHIGDTQAPVTTRTSGVGASARSLIYADGVLLSALIGNNNSTASPRWGMVAPDEISRITVSYGPFSAAYPGNAISAVINIATRTPESFEMSARLSVGSQAFSQYATKGDYPVRNAALAIGDRRGPLAFRFSANHLETRGQPLSYLTAVRPVAPSSAGTSVSGAFADRNRAGAAIAVLGAGGLEAQHQDTAKLKLGWSPGSAISVGYLIGYFGNRTDAHVENYLRDARGAPVYAGGLNIGGFAYANPASGFAGGMYRLRERHWMQALSLSGVATPQVRWDAIATVYDYGHDAQRTPSAPPPAALSGGGGTILDLSGTGWRTFDGKVIWTGIEGQTISVGLHNDRYVLGSDRYNTSDWLSGPRGVLAAASHGKTQTTAAFVEDALRLGPQLGLTLGLRQEHWRAFDGSNFSLTPALSVRQPELSADRASPKAVLSWTPSSDWQATASLGRAYRFPTVSELYQSVMVGALQATPNPNLKPEAALSSELSVKRSFRRGSLRVSAFTEAIRNALISQTAPIAGGSASFVQNVDKVRSRGLEAVAEAHDVGVEGLDLQASATYVDAKTLKDAAFPAAIGKRAPQVPKWRWTALATWRATDTLTLTGAARYSSRPFGTLDNSDPNGHTYQGFEGYLVVDARASWQIDNHWSAALGVDNLNSRKYYVFHPFPQRSVQAELRYVY